MSFRSIFLSFCSVSSRLQHRGISSAGVQQAEVRIISGPEITDSQIVAKILLHSEVYIVVTLRIADTLNEVRLMGLVQIKKAIAKIFRDAGRHIPGLSTLRDSRRIQARRFLPRRFKMLSTFIQVVLAITVLATTVFAQIDRARDAPYADFIRYHNDVVKYAEQKDRDGALKASADLRKGLGAMFGFSQDVPKYLNDGNLRELASQAQSFLDTMKDYSGKLNSLEEKLKRTGEDYSSELS